MRAIPAAVVSILLLLVACNSVPTHPMAIRTAVESRKPITFRDLLSQSRAEADHRLAYGSDALQFGDLWLPREPGLHPVIILIHGGCWRADLPGLELMAYMAADLRERGYAVWNLEYRRIGHPGGGYPGTFRDIAAGVDHLRALAPEYGLDLDRVVVSGHSAGGHLALWAAARDRLPPGSGLRVDDPLPVRGVVSLAGIADLKAYRETGPDACGGPSTIDGLVGEPTTAGRDVYADTSPPALAPLGPRQIVISGELDPIVPPRFGATYAAIAARRGRAVHIEFPGAGHFELIDPTSAAWPGVVDAYAHLLR
jgi:acetyl esterase/lipase